MAHVKLRKSRAANGTLLRVLSPFVALILMVGCSGDNTDNNQPQGSAGVGNAGTGGSSSTGGSGGSGNVAGSAAGSGQAGDAGSGGSAGEGGSGGSGGNNAGSAGAGNTGNNGGAGGTTPCGEAGHGSTTEGEGACAGAGGSGSTGTGGAGSAGIGGSSGSSGSGSAGSNAGSAGTAGTGNAGAGGSAGSAAGSSGTGGVAGSAGTGGAGSNAGSAGSAGNAGTGGAVQNTYTCTNGNRDAALDAANTDQFPFVGGIWGTGANNVYVTLHNQNVSSGVLYWNGVVWIKIVMPGTPPELNGIWGSSDDDIWVTGRNSKGFLYHKSGGTWSEDSNRPNGKSFKQVWGTSADDVWLLGADSGWNYRVWRRNGGTTWVQQSLPSVPVGTELRGLWGIGGHIFVTGHTMTNSNPSGGVLLHFDGSSWESMPVPGTATELAFMSGTSINDLFITGSDGAQGIVHHLTNGLATWTSYITSDVAFYAPVLSKKPGTFWAGGSTYVGQANMKPWGSARVTTSDSNGVLTSLVDGIAYQPAAVWSVPGSDTVLFASTTSNQNGPSGVGLYSSSCN